MIFNKKKKNIREHLVLLRRIPAPPKGEWGGMERLMLDWLERIDYESCHATIAVSPGWGGRFHQETVARNLPVRVVEFPFSLEVGPGRRFVRIFLFLKRLRPTVTVFLQGWFWEFRLPDLIAANLLTGGRVFMHENLGADAPIPKTSRKYFGLIPGFALWWYHQIGMSSGRALLTKKIITVSQGLKDRMVELWKYPSNKIQVIYHGVDTARLSHSGELRERMRQEHGIKSEEKMIMMLCRLTKQKRVDRALEAFAAISKESPQVRMTIIGGGPQEQELKRLAATYSLNGTVRFLGHVDHPKIYLTMSDIYLLTSDNEGLSLSLMEAMACGLICVSTDCPGSGEAIENGVNGFLTEMSPSGVRAGLKKALTLTLEQRIQMGELARKTALEKFEINQNIQRIFEVFGIPFDHKAFSNSFSQPASQALIGSREFIEWLNKA